LLLPVISITDDLSQSISLAEGTRMQDVLKAPDLRGTHYSTLMLPVITLAALRQPATPAWSFHAEVPITRYQLLRTASIEKRPPPRFV
jgi:hypothetical protein